MVGGRRPTQAEVWAVLRTIPDPEIPVLSLVELGVISGVEVEGGTVRVGLRPTFAGCPALETMRRDIDREVSALGAARVEVPLELDPPWSTDDIAPEARPKLEAFGLSPAPGPVIRLDEILAVPQSLPQLRLLRHRGPQRFRAHPVSQHPCLPELHRTV